MERKSINIHEFYNKFCKEYEFLYKSYDNVAGFREAVEAFDIFLKAHAKFVAEFCRFRGDLITSDREAAAFMFTMESMKMLKGDKNND